MSNIVVANSALPTLLSALGFDSGDPGPLFEASVRLFQNDFVPNPSMVEGDFDIATYTGYANQMVTAWNGPILTPGGIARITAPGLWFAPSGPEIINTIFGYYVLGAGNALMYARRFDTPQIMNGVLSGFMLVPHFDLVSRYAA